MHSKCKMIVFTRTIECVMLVCPHMLTEILTALQMKIMTFYCPVFCDGYKKAVDLK